MEVARNNLAELVRRIRACEAGAEDELVERFSRGVQFIIHQSVSDQAAADDIFQDVFRLTLEKIRAGEVREPERLAGFLASVARNTVIESFRKMSRRKAREEPQDDRQFSSPAPSQLEQLLREEKANLVRRVLAEMTSDRDRQVLQRFYIADEDKEAICEDLQLSSLHFNQVLCRARERYKKLFESIARK
jgi:RNA polymerase sigma-70 factor (ECF subfamily)